MTWRTIHNRCWDSFSPQQHSLRWVMYLWCSFSNSTCECTYSAVFSCVECWSDNVAMSQRETAVTHSNAQTENSSSHATRACPAQLLVGDTMVTMLLLCLRWRKLVDSLVEMARVFLDWTLSVKSTTRYLCTCISLQLVSSWNMCCLMTAYSPELP